MHFNRVVPRKRVPWRAKYGPESAIGVPAVTQDSGRNAMKREALFFGIFTAAVFVLPAFAADEGAGMFDLRWGKNAFNFEGMPSGPQPLKNLSRRPDGTANAGRLVGDYKN